MKIDHQLDGSWQCMFGGTAETVRGVGDNPWYADLSVASAAIAADRLRVAKPVAWSPATDLGVRARWRCSSTAPKGQGDLDRAFGLVNPDGIRTDGALAALGSAYLGDGATTDTPTG